MTRFATNLLLQHNSRLGPRRSLQVDGLIVGQTRVLEAVDAKEIARLFGELDRSVSLGLPPLHQKRVVIPDKVPD